jgi:hypothetical protein
VAREQDDPDGLTALGALQVDAVIVSAAQQHRMVTYQGDQAGAGEETDASVVAAAMAVRRYIEGG